MKRYGVIARNTGMLGKAIWMKTFQGGRITFPTWEQAFKYACELNDRQKINRYTSYFVTPINNDDWRKINR